MYWNIKLRCIGILDGCPWEERASFKAAKDGWLREGCRLVQGKRMSRLVLIVARAGYRIDFLDTYRNIEIRYIALGYVGISKFSISERWTVVSVGTRGPDKRWRKLAS